MAPARSAPDPATQYRALTESAGVVLLEHRTMLIATGDDRAEFLQGMLTNDVVKLAVGEACPALLLTIQGRVTADVDVLRLDDALWLLLDATAAAATIEALERLIVADDVTLRRDDENATLAVIGPAARGALGDVVIPEPWRHVECTVADVPVRLLRGAPFGDDDVTIVVRRGDAASVYEALVAGGAEPCAGPSFEARRIALGVPRIGVDMGGDTLAIEMPVDARISHRKGCYLGQEIVARGTSRGQVNRRLRGVRFDGPPPAAGTSLFAGEKDVGRVTSTALLPNGDAIGLAIVRREHWESGAVLSVGAPDGERARVAEWPLA